MENGGTPGLSAHYDELYERYGRPLEGAFAGKYLAVAPDGRTVMANTRLEAATRAQTELGNGVYLYRIGERSVGRWR